MHKDTVAPYFLTAIVIAVAVWATMGPPNKTHSKSVTKLQLSVP